MTDIATLGLAVDSSQVVTATSALGQFVTAAKPAADAAASLETAAKGISGSMTAVAPAAASAAAGTMSAAAGVDKLALAARPAAVAMADLEATLSAYVADQEVMGVAQANGTAATDKHSESLRGQRMVLRGLSADLAIFGTGIGQYAGLAGMMFVENEHLVQGFGGLKNTLVGLLTPTNLLIGAFAAIAVGGYEAITSIVAQEKALDDLAHRTDETIQSLHGLEAAAAFKGIDSTEFEKTMTQFQGQVETLSSGLNELFRANHVDDSGGLKDSLISLGDLIKNAGDESTKYKLIQEAGLPATRQWVDFLSQGSVAIGAAAAKMGPLGSAMDPLVQKAKEFDDKWNTSIKNFSDGWRGAVIETIAWFDQLGPKISGIAVSAAGMWSQAAADAMQHQIAVAQIAVGNGTSLNANSNVDQFYRGTGAGNGATPSKATTKSATDIKTDIANNQQLLGLLGPLASVDQVVAQKENDITLARLASVPVTKKQEQAILAYTLANALGITQIHSQTDALTVQSQTFGMLSGQAAAFTAVQTKINEANRTGNPLTQQQVVLLQNESAALSDATERLYEMNTANEALSGGFKTFRQDMENGTSAWTALKDAAVSALNSISDKLIDMASKNLVAAAFGGSSGSGSLLGWFTGLFGGGSAAPGAAGIAGQTVGLHDGGVVGSEATFGRYIHPAYFDNAPRFHDGGITGDEVPIIAKAGEGVFTPGQMAKLAPVGAGGGSPPVNVNVYQNNDFRGTDPSSIARINAALVQTKNQAVSESVNAILKLQKNAPGVARPQ